MRAARSERDRLGSVGVVAAAGATGVLVVVGRGVPLWLFLVLCVVAFGGLCAYVVARAAPSWLVLGAVVGVMVLAVVVPPQTSRDLYAYAMYGRIAAVHHDSPYVHPPSVYPDDAFLAEVKPVFRETRSVYGPAFTAWSALGMWVVGSSKLGARLFFQGTAALAVLVAFVLLRRRQSPFGAGAFGLHPVIAASVVNGGHTDAIVGVALLGAAVCAESHAILAGTLLALAMTVKATSALVAAAICVWTLVRRGWRAAVVMAATAGTLTLAAYVAAGGRAALEPLRYPASLVSRHSIWHGVHSHAFAFSSVAFLAVAAICVAARLRHVSRAAGAVNVATTSAAFTDERAAVRVGAVAVAPYLLGAPYVLPWYAGGALPLVAFEAGSWLWWIVATHAMALFAIYPAARGLGWAVRYAVPAAEAAASLACVILAIRERRSGWRRTERERGTPERAD